MEDYVKNDGGISTHITWNVKNAGDFSNVNIAVYCCFNLAKQPTPHRQNIEKWLNTSTMPDRQFKRDIEEMLQTLLDIVSSHKYNKAFQANKISQRVAPVEFVFICRSLHPLECECLARKRNRCRNLYSQHHPRDDGGNLKCAV